MQPATFSSSIERPLPSSRRRALRAVLGLVVIVVATLATPAHAETHDTTTTTVEETTTTTAPEPTTTTTTEAPVPVEPVEPHTTRQAYGALCFFASAAFVYRMGR